MEAVAALLIIILGWIEVAIVAGICSVVKLPTEAAGTDTGAAGTQTQKSVAQRRSLGQLEGENGKQYMSHFHPRPPSRRTSPGIISPSTHTKPHPKNN
jgi:hypothetical protein